MNMRNSKLFALAAFGMLAAGSAVADDPAPIQGPAQVQDFFVVMNSPMMEVLCVVSAPNTVGMPVLILANGMMPVGAMTLLPGANLVIVPQTGAASFEVLSAEIEGKWVALGSN